MRSCWWPRVVVEICPSASPRRMYSGSRAGHKRTTASRSSKRSKAQCRDRVRAWAQPSPLGHDGMPLCAGKRRTDGQISPPEPGDAKAVLPRTQRHSRSLPAERSNAAPRRTSTSAAGRALPPAPSGDEALTPRQSWRLLMLVNWVLGHHADVHTLSRNPAAHTLRMARPDWRYTNAADKTPLPNRLCLPGVCTASVPAVRCQKIAIEAEDV